MFNIVAFQRLSKRDAPSAQEASPRDDRKTETPQPPPPALDVPPRSSGDTKSTTPIASPPLKQDPKVTEILQAQDSYGAFSKELDRVFKARPMIDEAKFLQTVLASTADYLELQEPARSTFGDAAVAATKRAGDARQERDNAQATVVKKDKSDPAAYAAYQQQKDAIDARYREQMKAAVDSLRPVLNSERPRHLEFLSHSERWLRNLARPPK